jgi:DNA invertase Pin-like site-specific DNA recombinase
LTEKQQNDTPWGIYTRISRVRRRTEAGKVITETLGVERQAPPCKELVKRKGGHVAETYVDNDRSAFKGVRPEFERMLAEARDGRIKAIAVWDSDRLTRNPDRDNARILELHDKYGVQLAAVTGEYDLATSSGRMMFRIQGAVAVRESEHRGERMALKMDELAQAGKSKGGGIRAFGFERDGKTINRVEAGYIREAADRLLAGESTAALTRDWQERGITTPTGRPWAATKLHRMLTSPRVVGLRQHRGEVLDGVRAEWPAILDRGRWERLRLLLNDPARSQRGPSRRYWLSGIVRCAGCQQPWHAHNDGRGHVQYKCRAGGNYAGCGRYSISQRALDAYVERQLLDWLGGPGLARARQALAEQDADVEAISTKLREDDQQLEELAGLYGQGSIKATEWMKAREPIERRIAAARTKLARMPKLAALDDLPAIKEELEAAWPDLPLERRRAILKSVVRRLVIYPGRSGSKFDSRRVVLAFIDRKPPANGTQTAIVPVDLPADDPELAGIREKVETSDVPQHETDPGLLHQVAQAMEEKKQQS